MKKGIVPGKDLVYKNVAIVFQAAGSRRNSHSQGECVFLRNFGCEWKEDGAFESRLTKFGWLDGQAGTLLARLCPDPWLQVNDI